MSGVAMIGLLLSVVFGPPALLWLLSLLEFREVYVPGVGAMLRRGKILAMTLGSVCLLSRKGLVLTDQQRRHERTHHHQWRVRPFMGYVYLYWLFVRGYHDDPLEVEARREAGEEL